jgi:hypothetical protein
MIGIILIAAGSARNANLPETMTGLDRSQKAEIRRAVREGTTVARRELANAVGVYARHAIIEHERRLSHLRTGRWVAWLGGALLLVVGVMFLADADHAPGDFLAPVVGLLGLAVRFVNQALSRRRIARAEAALVANGHLVPADAA